jgi:solute carrier family 25 aspartate/glutamate transporter 12/13
MHLILDHFQQYPWQENKLEVKTALTTPKRDEMSQIRARNALKILLDVHGDFGRRAANFSHPLVKQATPTTSPSKSA